MFDNKLVKTVLDTATFTGLAAGIGWVAKKAVNWNFITDPSNSAMNYVKFTAVMAGSIVPHGPKNPSQQRVRCRDEGSVRGAAPLNICSLE